ncbi:hypothetical protein BH23PLA1_BH23PLA1_12400 [soil metagenome]
MSPWIGLVLRLLGPALQLACIALLFQVRGQERTILGVPLEWFCYTGLVLGVILVVLGLGISLPGTRSRRPRR